VDSLAVGAPDRLLLIYTDRSDPVTRAILEHPARLPCEVIAISLGQLVNELEADGSWAGHGIDPARTALVNRITSLQWAGSGEQPESAFQQTQLWMWLDREVRRFAYASSRPTVHSVLGGYGTLLDQWLDLPALVGGLRVPGYRTPWNDEPLKGEVYAVDPRQLYQLGKPLSASQREHPGLRLEYVRPGGFLVQAAQVGRMFLCANAPPFMTSAQHDYIAAFVDRMAARSAARILEHTFFVGEDLPVFYATSPEPVITGGLPEYPELVLRGLIDDLARCDRRPV